MPSRLRVPSGNTSSMLAVAQDASAAASFASQCPAAAAHREPAAERDHPADHGHEEQLVLRHRAEAAGSSGTPTTNVSKFERCIGASTTPPSRGTFSSPRAHPEDRCAAAAQLGRRRGRRTSGLNGGSGARPALALLLSRRRRHPRAVSGSGHGLASARSTASAIAPRPRRRARRAPRRRARRSRASRPRSGAIGSRSLPARSSSRRHVGARRRARRGPSIRSVTSSSIVGPPPVRACSSAACASRYTASRSVPSTTTPSNP